MRPTILMAILFCMHPVFGKTSEAIFAGGCFWCMEADFDKVPGVLATQSGFDGGTTINPTYESVSTGNTGYAESVRVSFDSEKISYRELVAYFWKHIDPTVADKQFCDIGHQYRSAIFYLKKEQRDIAIASKKEIEKLFSPVYTEITASTHFYEAEEYHQNYHINNPWKYKYYRYRCGRDSRIQEVWKDAKN